MGQDRKNFVAFDQYQRYETISKIINYYRGQERSKVFRILELGANEHKDMRLFLPDDEILFTDIVLTESMQNDPDFQQADGTCLPFKDKSFDFVFAADVLEHISVEKREYFLSEACRVVRKCAILSFPFQSPDVIDAETRVNSYYKAISGQDFIWLHEHSVNGLPELGEIDGILDKLNCHYFSFFHGDIRTWEKMWYCHFDTVFAPETLEYRENIDHYYNCNLYSGDISESCYRVFYVMPQEDQNDLEQYVSTLWNPVEKETREFLTTLFHAHEHVHPLFMQDRLQKELTDKEVHIQNLTALHRVAEEQWSAQLEQYRQQQESDAQALAERTAELEHYRQQQESDAQALAERAAELEQYRQQQESDAQALAEQASELEHYRQQQESDAQALAERAAELEHYRRQQETDQELLAEQANRLEQYRLRKKNDEQLLADIGKHCDEIEEELAHYKEHYLAAINQREELKQQLAQAQYAYHVISNAFFWKITKPFRFTVDSAKSLLRRNRYTHLICKGLKCWKENGFAYTWKKVQDRRHHRQDFAKAALPIFTAEELERQKSDIFSRDIKFSILVPLYNTPERFLHEMIQSVLDQTYSNWELCMADGSDKDHHIVEKICKQYTRKDRRILYRKLGKNLGISENTNACIDMATGDYIALFDHDDLLHPAALHEAMKAICEQGADFIYTDEATFESPNVGKIITAHFKPDFAPDNLRANNYICHLSVFSWDVLKRAGRFNAKYDGSQDHDMILRLTSQAKRILHIPKILYYWRSHPASVAQDITSKEYAVVSGRNAVRDNVLKCGYEAEVESSRAFPTIYRLKYKLVGEPKVSIIIPNKNHLLDIQRCIKSILSLTTYSNYEVIIVDNGSDDPAVLSYYDQLKRNLRFTICTLDIPFNYSRLNNFAMKEASGEYYIFMNNDIEIITPEWIEEMLMYAQREDVAAVGAMLYYPDNTIQHAGIILGLGADRIAGHAFYKCNRDAVGYMGRLCYAQNVSAVTAACMMVKASVYKEIGGFDEEFKVAYNDVDLCMRIRQAGYLIVWTPYAELYHYESKSRGLEDTPEKRKRFESEVRRFQNRWSRELAAGDPYYNPNLTLDREDFSLR